MKKNLAFAVALFILLGCTGAKSNIMYSPSNLKLEFENIELSLDSMTPESLIVDLQKRGIFFEIEASDRSMPCKDYKIVETKHVIQAYDIFSDDEIIRFSVSKVGEITCVARLIQNPSL